MAASIFAVGGSRGLPAMHRGTVDLAVLRLLRAGHTLAVGCCVGVDAAAIAAASPIAPRRVQVLAAFGPSEPRWVADQSIYGAPGACAFSAVHVVAEHLRRGGPVEWWAGGPPQSPIRSRLVARTRAVVSLATCGIVLFFRFPSSRGSRLAARLAVERGLPVFAFPLGFSGVLLPSLGLGEWVPVSEPALLPGAWSWAPSPGIPALRAGPCA